MRRGMPACRPPSGPRGAVRRRIAQVRNNASSPVGSRDPGSDRRRGHRIAEDAQETAAGPLRHRRPPAAHRPHDNAPPGSRPQRCRSPGLVQRRTPVDGLDLLRRMGQPGSPGRHPGPARARRGSRRRRHPRQHRPVAAPSAMAPPAPRPVPRRSSTTPPTASATTTPPAAPRNRPERVHPTPGHPPTGRGPAAAPAPESSSGLTP